MNVTAVLNPPSSTPPSSCAELDRAIEELSGRGGAWVETAIAKKIHYLRGLSDRTWEVAVEQVGAQMRAKGLKAGTPREAEEWLGGPVCQLRVLRLLRESLESIARTGEVVLPPGVVRTRTDGQVVVDVFPFATIDRILHTGFRAEVWMEPGVAAEALSGHMAALYRDSPPQPGVALVLGAGNVASIGALDAVHKLFVEGRTVVLKLNPVNEYLGPFIEKVFEELIEDGFFRVAYGGGEVGEYLCHHDGIDEIHITGSGLTHDRIVFGDGEEGAARKAANQPVLEKRITSELGNVSPVILVPGEWAAKEIRYHAENVATQMTQNGGFNCNAAKVLILHEDWPQAGAFLEELRSVLRSLPPRRAYYPGAEERFDRFLAAYPEAEMMSERREGEVPPTLIPGVAYDDPNQLAFSSESFCSVTAQTAIGGTDAADYLRRAVDFCNHRLHGTLNAEIIIDPATQRSLGTGFEEEIARLRYGAIAVNHWPAISFALGSTTWGAFPGHTVADIQSGIGCVHNTLLFDRPQRSVIYGPFYSWPKPPWFCTHRNAHLVAARLAAMEHRPSLLRMPALLARAVRA